MGSDPQSGFTIKLIGFHPADKVANLVWSPCGDVFATAAKTVWCFYFIEQLAEQSAEADEIKPIIRGKGGKQLAMQTKNILKGDQVRYEFRKTARQESMEAKTVGVWDELGRFLAIYGVKSGGTADKFKNIRIFNIFGEPLQQITQIPDL
jgi:hypothetical protein